MTRHEVYPRSHNVTRLADTTMETPDWIQGREPEGCPIVFRFKRFASYSNLTAMPLTVVQVKL